MKIVFLVLMLGSLNAFAGPGECKLSFYNFNKAHESRIQAVGVDYGGGSITLGFRRDVSPDLQEQADMESLMRACIGSRMMEPMLYQFKRDSKYSDTIYFFRKKKKEIYSDLILRNFAKSI